MEALLPDLKGEPLAKLINDLANSHRVALTQLPSDDGTSEGGVCITLVDEAEAELLSQLNGEQNILYQHIKSAGNRGIWIKDLLRNTGLHRTVITKHIKTLEAHSIIKPVRSVKYPTRKIYMLFDLTPAVELTGGAWFSDNELDSEFIRILGLGVLQFVRQRCQPTKPGAFVPLNSAVLPSTKDVVEFIATSGLTSQDLEQEDVEQLLDMLVYDRMLQKLKVVKAGKMMDVYYPQRIQEESSRKAADEVMPGWNLDNWTQVPCGTCTVMDDCSIEMKPKTLVSPFRCEYYTTLFNDL